jgi:hypothetical protein
MPGALENHRLSVLGHCYHGALSPSLVLLGNNVRIVLKASRDRGHVSVVTA